MSQWKSALMPGKSCGLTGQLRTGTPFSMSCLDWANESLSALGGLRVCDYDQHERHQ
jgi:hypothetical protein